MCLRNTNPDANHLTGHALMLSCPPDGHYHENPDDDHYHQLPEIPNPELMKLLALSYDLPLNGEMAPVQALQIIRNHARAAELTPRDFRLLTERLFKYMNCYGNTQGTLNYQNRIHVFDITFTPATNATVTSPSPPNLLLTYKRTTLLTDPQGNPTTGLDADPSGGLSISGFPLLPVATYTGNGFGQPGSGGKRISLDTEGLVLARDGSYWISDEYGPYIYHFGRSGKLLTAIQPPAAYIPTRNGTSFSAN
ncbi:MAG: hypothetical protein Q9223_004362, partial [Gallowayella weberi]